MGVVGYYYGPDYDYAGGDYFQYPEVSYGSNSDRYTFFFDTSYVDQGYDPIPTLINLTTGETFLRYDLNPEEYSYYLDFSTNTAPVTLNGGLNGDVLFGGSGADRLLGDDGGDYISGGLGADRMEGGAGNDSFSVDNTRDLVLEAAGAGYDAIATTASYTLQAGQEIESLNAVTANAVTLTGNEFGQAVYGDAGRDALTGAGGRDVLLGAGGADRFIYKAVSDSTVAATGRDLIGDFSRAEGDKIDLRLIDANTRVSGDQAFSFIGNAGFSKVAGQLQAKFVGSDTLVSGDVDGNGGADFSILLEGRVTLGSGDFLL